MTTKVCSSKNGCGKEKDTFEFISGTNWCKECQSIYNKKYREINKNKIKELKREYQVVHKEERTQYLFENKERIRKVRLEYDKNHTEVLANANKLWIEKNKESRSDYMRNYCRKYRKNRREIDPIFNLRTTISTVIGTALKKNSGSKYGESILSFLPYSIKDLKEHIEKQFESWMTWNNQGMYNPKTWDDNDSTTWTWQLDHIIPQSNLIYLSMIDDNFQKCWDLSNLRPLSAKLNILDGNRRTF